MKRKQTSLDLRLCKRSKLREETFAEKLAKRAKRFGLPTQPSTHKRRRIIDVSKRRTEGDGESCSASEKSKAHRKISSSKGSRQSSDSIGIVTGGGGESRSTSSRTTSRSSSISCSDSESGRQVGSLSFLETIYHQANWKPLSKRTRKKARGKVA